MDGAHATHPLVITDFEDVNNNNNNNNNNSSISISISIRRW